MTKLAVPVKFNNPMKQVYDGFWLPENIRSNLITPTTDWVVQYHANGVPTNGQNPEAIGARWPILSTTQWGYLLKALKDQRKPIPPDFIGRLTSALRVLFQQFQLPENPFTSEAIQISKAYTGYSQEMIRFATSIFEETPFEEIEEMLCVKIPASAKTEYKSLKELDGPEGRVRFYPKKSSLLKKIYSDKQSDPLPYKTDHPQMVLGYASGNVLGTAFIINLLGQISALVNPNNSVSAHTPIPAVLVKNSRQEPFFVPFLFSALERIDPDLLSTSAIMIWDYEDESIQDLIISEADLVLAAAADSTIQQIDQQIKHVKPSVRFQPHGHKTSFTTIGKAYLANPGDGGRRNPQELLGKIALLAAIDSILWDQNGCLSSRIHFIEQNSETQFTSINYGQTLVEKLRLLSKELPRGAIPLSRIHDRFDHFNAQTISPQFTLCSNYEDDFIVVVDNRPWEPIQFRSIVNTCMERTIVIRPVDSVLDVPNKYLKQVPANNLQTIYIAIDGEADNNWSNQLTQFVEKVGKCGVTSIRSIGQSPFPQLAFSWDGYLPQSLSLNYPKGYFTTVEFNHNYTQIMQTSQWLENRLGQNF